MKIYNNSNSQQALWIALGSFASFGVSVITSMILSRFFCKSDYGTYKQVMYVYNTLLTVFTLGLPQAYGYFLPRVGLNQGKDIVNKITGIFYLLGACFSALLFFGASSISSLLENPELTKALRIFSIVPFFMLPTMGLESIYSTYRKTHIAALYSVATRVLLILCVVLPVVSTGGTYVHAIVGFVIASFFSFVISLLLIQRPFKGMNNIKSDYSIKDILNFSLPLAFAGIWGLVINSVDQFFVSRYFGTETFAEFSNGAMELPFVGMIISACTTVLYPLFSKYSSENRDPKESIFPVWRSVFVKTAMLIYPMVAYCLVFADDLMAVLYGDLYLVSGGYFRIKLIANFFTLIAFAPVILSIGKTRYYANVHMISALLLVGAEYIIVKIVPNPFYITWASVLCHIGRIFAMLYAISEYFGVKIIQLFPIKS